MKAGNRAAIIVLLLVVLALLFFQTPLMRQIRGRAWDTLTAVSGRLVGIGSLSLSETAQQQLERLQAENVALKSQLAEYGRLKRQLGTPTVESRRAIEAAVVSEPVDPFQNRYVLSKGIRDGVPLGAPVLLSGTTLVGFIADISQQTSTLELLFVPTTNITAEVVFDDPDIPAVKGLLTGRHYTSLRLSTIPRTVPLQAGQAVVTAASDSLPAGLFIGKLGTITNKENEPYQTAQVVTDYTPREIEAVTILAPP